MTKSNEFKASEFDGERYYPSVLCKRFGDRRVVEHRTFQLKSSRTWSLWRSVVDWLAHSRLLCHHLNEVNYSTVPVWVLLVVFIQQEHLANLLTLFNFDAGGAAHGESHMLFHPFTTFTLVTRNIRHIPHHVAFVFSFLKAIGVLRILVIPKEQCIQRNCTM